MMKKKSFYFTAAVATVALAGAVVWAADEDEQKISLTDAPAAVQAAITKAVGSSTIKKVTKETKKGETKYEAEFDVNKVEHSVEVSATGEVLEEETEIDAKTLPQPVTDAVKAKYVDGTLGEANEVKEKGSTFYEVDVKVGKDQHELKIDSSGKVLKDKIENEKDGD